MCWKRYDPDPEPSPTPMANFVSSTEGFQSIANATEGDTRCPDVATICSTTWKYCENGICCERNGEAFCSCNPGWTLEDGDQCDIRLDPHASLAEASSNQIVLIVVLIAVVLLALVIIAIIVYRKISRSRNEQTRHNQNENPKPSKDLPLSDVMVATNSASTSLLPSGEDTNGK